MVKVVKKLFVLVIIGMKQINPHFPDIALTAYANDVGSVGSWHDSVGALRDRDRWIIDLLRPWDRVIL